MATTQNTYTGDDSTTLYSFTFPYIKEDDIKVSLDGVDTNQYTLANATQVQFTTAPSLNQAIRIYRVTNTDASQATFFSGSSIRAEDLNNNQNQILYATQETVNRRIDSTGGTMSGDLNMGGNKITNVADPTVGTDVVTKDYLDTFSFNPAGTGNVDFTGNITVAGTSVFTGAATFSGDVTINSTGYLKLPVGTTGERPGTAAVGMVRFNSTTGKFEGSPDGTNWSLLGGGATGGGSDTVFVETGQLISEDYTLTTGPTKAEKRNAISAGPVEIASGKVVEVPSGQSWVIV